MIISFHQTISESKTHFKTHICWFDYNVEAWNTTKDRHTIKENRKQKENDRVKANPEKRTRNTELKKKKQEEGHKHINTTITFNVLCSSAMNHILFFFHCSFVNITLRKNPTWSCQSLWSMYQSYIIKMILIFIEYILLHLINSIPITLIYYIDKFWYKTRRSWIIIIKQMNIFYLFHLFLIYIGWA